MHTNANKCAGLVDHTYIHKRRRVDSRLEAKTIAHIATKMGCPEEKTTKIAKLMWICTEYLHDPHGYN